MPGLMRNTGGGKGGSSLGLRAQSSEKGNRSTAREHLASTGAQVSLLLALFLAPGRFWGTRDVP